MYRVPSPYGQPSPRAPSPYGQPSTTAPSPYVQPSTATPSPYNYNQKLPFPYGEAPPRSHSPQPPPQRVYTPQPLTQPAQPPASDIVPGSQIYTTSVSPDGRVLYHPFKAVAASYQTPNGVVSGIQWMPAEATHTLPQDAQPASKGFTWNRGNKDKDKLIEWQHEEDKRRKREEKEAAKRLRQQQEHRNEEKAKEYERARRMSFNTGYPPVDFPATQSAGHPGSPYQHHVEPTTSISGAPYGRERKHSNVGDYDILNRQLGDMDLNRESGVNGPGYPRTGPYGSQGSTGPYGTSYTTGYAASGSKYSPNPRGASELPFTPPGGKYSPNPGRAQLPQFTAGSGNRSHPSSVYSSSARGNDPIAISASPYGVASSLQPAVYPRGHILEGQPTRSRASSLIQGPPAGAYSQLYHDQAGTFGSHTPRPPPSPRMAGASPHFPGRMLPATGQQFTPPEGFSRPINPNMSYSEFATIKIQAMEDFLMAPQPPRMPPILKSHDVFPEDWLRLMNDLRLAWSGNLPVPDDNHGGKPPRRTTLVANLLDLWNAYFFLPRGSEVILYKGQERRSGQGAGTIDKDLPEDEPDKSESEDDDEDDESDLEDYLMKKATTYGPQPGFDPALITRKRREAKEEEKKARREARRKAKAKEKEKVYALYVTYVPPGGAGISGGYPSAATTGYVPVTPPVAPPVAGYGRHHGGY